MEELQKCGRLAGALARLDRQPKRLAAMPDPSALPSEDLRRAAPESRLLEKIGSRSRWWSGLSPQRWIVHLPNELRRRRRDILFILFADGADLQAIREKPLEPIRPHTFETFQDL